MPKVGMEPVRRKALVDATLRAVGGHGSLTVTMSEIARHAGVSPALAHHYFGSKEQLVIETIRSLLRTLRADAVAALKAASTPRERLSAVIRVNFQAHPCHTKRIFDVILTVKQIAPRRHLNNFPVCRQLNDRRGFFNARNIEVMVKVLDGCALKAHELGRAGRT